MSNGTNPRICTVEGTAKGGGRITARKTHEKENFDKNVQ